MWSHFLRIAKTHIPTVKFKWPKTWQTSANTFSPAAALVVKTKVGCLRWFSAGWAMGGGVLSRGI